MPSFFNMRIQKKLRIAYSGVCVISIIFFALPQQVLQCCHTFGIHSGLVGLLDLEVDFLAVDGHFLGCGNADLDLITFDLQNGDLDIVVDDDCFVLLTGQCQHLTHPPFRISGCRIPDILPGIYLPQG